MNRLVEAARAFVSRRQQCYARTFAGPEAAVVLKDLAKFCRAGKSTFHTDPRIDALQAGRQEVWLRIAQHLKMTEDDLYKLLGGPNE